MGDVAIGQMAVGLHGAAQGHVAGHALLHGLPRIARLAVAGLERIDLPAHHLIAPAVAGILGPVARGEVHRHVDQMAVHRGPGAIQGAQLVFGLQEQRRLAEALALGPLGEHGASGEISPVVGVAAHAGVTLPLLAVGERGIDPFDLLQRRPADPDGVGQQGKPGGPKVDQGG